MRRKARDRFVTAVGIALCAFCIAFGLAELLVGKLVHLNYWGDMVFSPMLILAGLFCLFIAIFGRKHEAVSQDKRGRPIRFPHEDCKKW